MRLPGNRFVDSMIMPVDIPLWMVAISVAFAVLIAKEAFGGTGMNILNPALTARAFAFFVIQPICPETSLGFRKLPT